MLLSTLAKGSIFNRINSRAYPKLTGHISYNSCSVIYITNDVSSNLAVNANPLPYSLVKMRS